jgi:hypothetical protein
MTDKEKISALAHTFPALRGAPGTKPFDEDRLREWMGVCSGGERRAASFILSVWNHYDNKFDVGEISGWDDNNLAAFAAWARAPWWC